MPSNRNRSKGFTLIAALLLTVLLSGIAVGLLYMVSNESRMGGNDLEGNMAYYAAEAGMENLTALLAQTYQTSQNPSAATITGLATNSANWPTAVSGSNISNVTYQQSITWPYSDASGNPSSTFDIVGAGPNQGMVASLIPFNLTVTAIRTGTSGQVGSNSALAATGAAVTMNRTLEVALLPAFEFGIFCDGDCDYFAGPNFNFGGRVHTNGNLFLASGSKLTFTDKIAAVGDVVFDQLENGHATSSGYTGAVYVPTATSGCPAAPGAGPALPYCAPLATGSWTGGFPHIAGSTNATGWQSATSSFGNFILDGATGAKKLQLPFVQSSRVGAIDIIRKPTPVDTVGLTNARLYSEASIRILLADTQGDLYPGETRTDSATQDIQIGTPFTNNSGNAYYAVTQAAPGVTAGNMYFATAQKQSFGSNNWTANAPTPCSNTLSNWPLFGEVTVAGNLCKGAWLRVEYLNAAGNWVGVTTEWLSYGFGRNYNQPPTHPYNSSAATTPLCSNFPSYPAGQCQNGISPAILILQQLQPSKTVANGMGASAQQFAWIPINFYDAREGEPRDTRPTGDTGAYCSPIGVMNTVELDVGNLWLWLKHPNTGPYSGGSGNLVNASRFNGYILYFADHRGMLPDPRPLTTFYPAPGNLSGMSGLADVINSGSAVGVNDGALEPISYYSAANPMSSSNPYSPEDVAVKGASINLGQVDKFGYTNLGAGFGIAAGNMKDPYYIYGVTNNANAIQCYSGSVTLSSGVVTGFTPTYGIATAEWNFVAGPRHALRLVDGGMDATGTSYVPPTGGGASNGTGFTVASEEPVYVYGDYNTGVSDPFWPSENTLTTPHSAAAIIADSVTLLSNPPAVNTLPTTKVGWTDFGSFEDPAVANSRNSNNSYYRMAIAAGKSIPFPQPAWGGQDMGTDGGMHNFLRYLEDRSGTNVNYAGSMISMYYSQYNTGIFKCCNAVYGAPTRNYFFDTLFLNPANLPPGTPMFQDVANLSYHESYTPQ